MNADVSRESTEAAEVDNGADTLIRLRRMEDKLDELLTDSRAARPLLEKYVRVAGSKAGAAWAGVSGRRR